MPSKRDLNNTSLMINEVGMGYLRKLQPFDGKGIKIPKTSYSKKYKQIKK